MNLNNLQNYNINVGINTEFVSSQTQQKLDDNKQKKIDKIETNEKNIVNVSNVDRESKKYSLSTLTYQEMSFYNENLTKDREYLKIVKENLDNLKNENIGEKEKKDINNEINKYIKNINTIPENEKEFITSNIDGYISQVNTNLQNNFEDFKNFITNKEYNNLKIDYNKESVEFNKNNIINLQGSFLNAQANLKQDYVSKLLG